MAPNPSLQPNHPSINAPLQYAQNPSDEIWTDCYSDAIDDRDDLLNDWLGVQLTDDDEVLTPSVSKLPGSNLNLATSWIK